MPCYFPLQGFRSAELTTNGKRKIIFGSGGYSDLPVTVPCGQCIGCRLERSRQWAIRCVHESKLHSENCFITLTYSSEFLPSDGSLVLRDWQLFMKKLRKKFGSGIRFFHCGEYGDLNNRPHYHACIFGFDFPDKKLWKITKDGSRLYTSDIIEKLWGKGFCTIGDVTFESAAYVARYVMKKITGEKSLDHYANIDLNTGEVLSYRKPEYVTMSRRPGIGSDWFKKYKDDVYTFDYVIMRGKKLKPPKFYDAQLEKLHHKHYEKIKLGRKKEAKKFALDNTPERLYVKHRVKLATISLLKRSI